MKYLFFFFIPLIGFTQNDTISICPYDTANVFIVVDEFPEFEGGEEVLKEYLEKYTPIMPPRECGIEGLYVVRFIVTEEGNLQNICIIRSFGSENYDDKIIEMISNMPKWKPGKHEGKLVKVLYNLPIRIKLQ